MFAFERTKLKDWIADVKSLIAKDLRSLPGWGAHTRCILPGYYVMRFGRAPESYIGYGAGLEQPVYVQQQMLASKATPGVPSRYEWIQEVSVCWEGLPRLLGVLGAGGLDATAAEPDRLTAAAPRRTHTHNNRSTSSSRCASTTAARTRARTGTARSPTPGALCVNAVPAWLPVSLAATA
jgi:hypothetical protein